MRLSYLRISLVSLLTQVVAAAPDNAGKEFMISFIENEHAFAHDFSCIPVDVYVSTPASTNVSVNVSAPRSNIMRETIQFSITKGDLKHLQLDCRLRNFGSTLSSKAIHIQATDEVVVYGINKQKYCTDGFLALPTDVLGTTHYTASYFKKGSVAFFTNILVVATQDNTSAAIRLANNDDVHVSFAKVDYGRNEWINLTMNRYETLQLESSGDLTGSLIESGKPVAVFSGNKKTSIRFDMEKHGVDHLVEQIPPTVTWGRKFVTVPIPYRRAQQVLRIIASMDDTQIEMSFCGDNRTFYKLDAGAWKQHLLPFDCYSHINSSHAILVVQFIHSFFNDTMFGIASDPAMFFVPPVEQYAADYIIGSPNATGGKPFTNFFIVVLKDSEKNELVLDGNLINSTTMNTFKKIGNTDLSGGFVFFGTNTEVHTLRHKSPISVFGVVAYGAAFYETYAFPVGLRLAPVNKACRNTSMVIADGLDNDCDGKIDEEICFSNIIDEDGDGSIDEDCAVLEAGVTRKVTGRPADSTTKMTTHQAVDVSFDDSSWTKVYEEPSPGHHEVFLPQWVQQVEIGILATISIIVIGMSVCFCYRCLGLFGKRQDDEDDDDKGVVWSEKKRPLPCSRPSLR